MDKQNVIQRVRQLVQEMDEARFGGEQGAKFAQLRGYADGYMKAALEAGLLNQQELLNVVVGTRTATIAPAQQALQTAVNN